MVFCPEQDKGDQNLKFTPLSERTSIAAPFIWESSPPRPPPNSPPPRVWIAGISVRNERWIIVLEVIIGAY